MIVPIVLRSCGRDVGVENVYTIGAMTFRLHSQAASVACKRKPQRGKRGSRDSAACRISSGKEP
jgi:hypothetical protein